MHISAIIFSASSFPFSPEHCQHQTSSLKDLKRLENVGRVGVHRAASPSLCISTYFMFDNSIELHLKFTWKISEKHQLFLRDIIFLLLTLPKRPILLRFLEGPQTSAAMLCCFLSTVITSLSAVWPDSYTADVPVSVLLNMLWKS